jgi:hypothetical protein
LRAIYFASTGPAQGRFNETLPNCSDVWYGAAFYLDNGFKTNNGNIALIEWSTPSAACTAVSRSEPMTSTTSFAATSPTRLWTRMSGPPSRCDLARDELRASLRASLQRS